MKKVFEKKLLVSVVLLSLSVPTVAFAEMDMPDSQDNQGLPSDSSMVIDSAVQAPADAPAAVPKKHASLGAKIGKVFSFAGRSIGYGLHDVSELSAGAINYTYGTIRSLDGKHYQINAQNNSGDALGTIATGEGLYLTAAAIAPPVATVSVLGVAGEATDSVMCRNAPNAHSSTYCQNLKNGVDFPKAPAQGLQSGEKLGGGISAFVGREWHFIFGHKKKAGQDAVASAPVATNANIAVSSDNSKNIGQGSNIVIDQSSNSASNASVAAPVAAAQ